MKYFVILLGVLFNALAQVFAKYTSGYEFWNKKFTMYILLSSISYIFTFLVQIRLMRLFPLSKIAPSMSVATMIVVFICGVWLFNEELAVRQIFGILFGAASIYLLLS